MAIHDPTATHAPTATHDPFWSEATHFDLEPPTSIWRPPTQSRSWEETIWSHPRQSGATHVDLKATHPKPILRREKLHREPWEDESGECERKRWEKKRKKEERGQRSLKWEEERSQRERRTEREKQWEGDDIYDTITYLLFTKLPLHHFIKILLLNK